MDDLGSRIKTARLRRGLTQKALADYICKCPSAVSGYENNTQVPPADTMISIASVLSVSLDYLVGFDVGITYSLRGLSTKQQEIINDILSEFQNPTSSSGQLSQQQMLILENLINQFFRPQ